MDKSRLEKLYKERRLIKELIRTDRERYQFLESRSQGIKTIINSEYSPIDNSYSQFAFYDMELAERITNKAKESIEILLNGEE